MTETEKSNSTEGRRLDTLDMFCSNRSCHKFMGVMATDAGFSRLIVDMSKEYLHTGKVLLLCPECIVECEVKS